MADFWIKVEKGTPDKPEVLEMSALLNINDPDTVLGKLIRVWSWFDSNSENGHAPIVTKVLLDRLTGVTGFVDAMIKVGWLTESKDGYEITNFDRHLGKGAKKRASDAERKRKSRENSEQCHNKSVTENGLDKSRVDKILKDESSPKPKANGTPFEEVKKLYNETFPMLAQCKELSNSRKGKIRTIHSRLKTIEQWNGYFNYVKENCTWVLSPKLNGSLNGIDWFIAENNFIKTKEGQYDDRT